MASSQPIEKYSNVSLNIFVLSVIKHQYSQKPSSTWRKNILATSYIKDPYSFFGSDSGIRVAQKTRNVWGSVSYHHRGKTVSALINDWENNIAKRAS